MDDDAARYAEALAFARDFLASDVWHCDWSNETFRAGAIAANLEWMRTMVGRELPPNISAENFDYLLGYAAHRIRESLSGTPAGKPGAACNMPVWLAAFLADVLEGKRKRPTKRGPPASKNEKRDWALWRAVAEVGLRFGYGAYHGGPYASKTPTAVEIVAEAADMSAGTVADIYKALAALHGGQPPGCLGVYPGNVTPDR